LPRYVTQVVVWSHYHSKNMTRTTQDPCTVLELLPSPGYYSQHQLTTHDNNTSTEKPRVSYSIYIPYTSKNILYSSYLKCRRQQKLTIPSCIGQDIVKRENTNDYKLYVYTKLTKYGQKQHHSTKLLVKTMKTVKIPTPKQHAHKQYKYGILD